MSGEWWAAIPATRSGLNLRSTPMARWMLYVMSRSFTARPRALRLRLGPGKLHHRCYGPACFPCAAVGVRGEDGRWFL